MQEYGKVFSRVYDAHWGHFANRAAPQIETYYSQCNSGQGGKDVLDLCCGTGQLALYFLQKGYRVTGIDLSQHMLDRARQHCKPYVKAGTAEFVLANVSDFHIDHKVGLAVATYDSLNHLPDLASLARCLQCVRRALVRDALFIFDLNTRLGLLDWNRSSLVETEKSLIMSSGFYDGKGDTAVAQLSGFVATNGRLYERFREMYFNTVFDMEAVRNLLLEAGWSAVHFARLQRLSTSLPDPEAEHRVFVVAGD